MRRLGADVYVLDYSEQSLRMIRLLCADGPFQMVLGDALACPFADQTFDVVFHQGLLEHLSAPAHLLAENHRILKDGGYLIVDVPQTFHFYTIMKHVLMGLGLWFGGWERQFTVASLTRLLEASGFRPVRAYGDWSKPGIFYKMARMALGKLGVSLPMYPRYAGAVTQVFYRLQDRLRRKRLFLYTVLSIGVICRKA